MRVPGQAVTRVKPRYSSGDFWLSAPVHGQTSIPVPLRGNPPRMSMPIEVYKLRSAIAPGSGPQYIGRHSWVLWPLQSPLVDVGPWPALGPPS